MLFKILKGPSSRISTDITPFHEGYAYVTEDGGDFYVDMMVEGKQKRVQINPDEIPSGGKDGQLLTKTATGWEWKDAPADGDMLASVYDPRGKRTDVYKYTDDTFADSAPNSQGTELIKGTQTEKTNLWTGVSTATTLYDGKIIDYYLPHDGNGATVTLTLTLSDGTVTGAIPVKMRGTRAITTHFTEKSIIHMVYVEANHCWQCQAPYWEIYYSGFVRSSAATLAKTANFTNFALKDNSWVQINMAYGNSAAKEITLNINNTGAKPIYINGLPSSDSNYELPAGTYFVFYDGTAYQFRTDGYLYGTVPTNRKVNGHALDKDVTVSKDDVGLSDVDNVKQYSADNPPPYPVTSVNGKTGEVTVNVPTVPTTTSLIKGNGSGGLVVATPETDYAPPVFMRKVTLTTAGWNSSTKQQTVTVTGVLADRTKQKVICSPVDESYDSVWNSCYVQCVGHGMDLLTFQCDEIPTAAVEVFVSIQSVNFLS